MNIVRSTVHNLLIHRLLNVSDYILKKSIMNLSDRDERSEGGTTCGDKHDFPHTSLRAVVFKGEFSCVI